ncbi:MAG: hypothetical protein ACREU9_00180 [Gammaproteobacteria bacterium]
MSKINGKESITAGPAMRTDAAWKRAAKAWLEADAAAEAAAGKLKALAGEASAYGAGVKVNHYFQAGSVAYAKIPELNGVDLEAYRGNGGWRHRISAI